MWPPRAALDRLRPVLVGKRRGACPASGSKTRAAAWRCIIGRPPSAVRRSWIWRRDLRTAGDDCLRLIAGKMVVELQPRFYGKDGAIAAFMAEPPFQGRIPRFSRRRHDRRGRVCRGQPRGRHVDPHRRPGADRGRLRLAVGIRGAGVAGREPEIARNGAPVPAVATPGRRRTCCVGPLSRQSPHRACARTGPVIDGDLFRRGQSTALGADRRLVVVSNRVGPIDPGKTSHGGLAVAIRAALEETGGLWFGFSGNVVERPSGEPKLATVGRVTAPNPRPDAARLRGILYRLRQSRAVAAVPLPAVADRLLAPRHGRLQARQPGIRAALCSRCCSPPTWSGCTTIT